MNTEKEAWIFLVSANPYLDYRTVIAPDFMCDNKTTFLLAQEAGGDLKESKIVYINDSKVGKLTLVFRVIEAIAEDLRIEGNGVLKDYFGREIVLIEGLVFKERLEEIKLQEVDFDQVHNKVKEHYREFWESIVASPVIPSSKEFFILKQSDNNSADYDSRSDVLAETKESNWVPQSINIGEEVFSLAYSNNYLVVRLDDKKQSLCLYKLDTVNRKIVESIDPFEHQCFLSKIIPIPELFNSVVKNFDLAPQSTAGIDSQGELIATGVIETDGNYIKIYSTKDQRLTLPTIKIGACLGDETRINIVVFADNDNYLIAGCKDGKLRFYDVKSGEIVSEELQHNAPIKAIAVSDSSKRAVSADNQGTIVIWNLATKTKEDFINNAHAIVNGCCINSLAFSPDGKTFASAGDDCSIKLWDLSTRKPTYTFSENAPINTITFSPDGTFLASGDDEGLIKIINLKTKQTSELKGHKKSVTSLAFTPDGNTLISGSKDETIHLWQQS
jgi:WD40 repeat protein